jgi:two-component system, NarL family, response regulator DesR
VTRPPAVLLAGADRVLLLGLQAAMASQDVAVAEQLPGTAEVVGVAAGLGVAAVLLAADLDEDVLARVAALADRGVVVLVVGPPPSQERLLQAVLVGIAGVLPPDVAPERLGPIVRAALDGEVVLPRRATTDLVLALRRRARRRLLVGPAGPAVLSERELDCLEGLVAGATTAQVALALQVSPVTVRRHVSAAARRLGLPDREALLALLRDSGPGSA